MRASVGDRVVVVSNKVDGHVRDGRIAELRHDDGSPPYVVEWSDGGQTGLFFPGPDAHVEHPTGEQPTTSEDQSSPAHVKTWRVEIQIFEQGDNTTANAVLLGESPTRVKGRGRAHRNPADADVPAIGDEVAAARALRLLADHLLETASEDIAAIEGRPVSLPR